MAAFFSNQLDFIFFFYGLAFILLGSICLRVARAASGGAHQTPWQVLAIFGFLHGGSEWLDLWALIAGDTPAFAISRTAVMTVSFMALAEFARLEAIRLGLKFPGRWIYAPMLLLVALGWHLSGLNGANAFARYAIGLPGAAATAAVLALHTRGASLAERRWISVAVAGFALYGLAAGVIVPPTPNWNGDFFNYSDFTRLTGLPIQLVRGLLACGIAFAIWGYWGQRVVRELGSPRYAAFMKRQFVWTLGAMASILVIGWVLTEYLGGIYKENVEQEAVGDMDLLSGRLNGTIASADGLVRVMAGSNEVALLLANRNKTNQAHVASVLRVATEVTDAEAGYILDLTGAVVAFAGVANVAQEQNFAAQPFFKSALVGEAGHYFAVSKQGKSRDYYASYPVRSEAGEVVGVALLKKSLDGFGRSLGSFDVTFFLIDSNGIVVVSNREENKFRTLWPLPPGAAATLEPLYGSIKAEPLLHHEIYGSSWDLLAGARDFLQRRNIAHSNWSLVTAMAPQGMYASRVLGIVITLQMTIMTLVYLVGRERWIHDTVQLQKRLDLEDLARELDQSATTDPLTGLYNRRKFDRQMAVEMMRSQRYGTPFALTLFDIDHFKVTNDTFGHQAGDNVLTELSRLVSARVRNTDVLARWGGEEFVILSPGIGVVEACQLAADLGAAVRGNVWNEVGTVTCSFGVAQFEAGDTAETLMERVDEALYRAKVNGRARVEMARPAAIVAPELAPTD